MRIRAIVRDDDANIFAGGHALHSVREWVSLQDMAAAAAVIVRLRSEARA